MFSPFDLPPGVLLLVTDQLSSPADFILYRGVIDHLKGSKQKRAVVLSTSSDSSRWRAIAAKSNLQLDNAGFTFIDILERVPPPDDPESKPHLLPILNAAVPLLTEDALVIVDDLATLDWLGFSVLDITRFCRALFAACRKVNATLLLRQHVLTPPSTEPILDDLFRALRSMCAYHLEVLPLASGKSGTVSGQVALHAGPGIRADGVKLLPRSSALQYRLTDAGAIFFERGTGAGVL
ncbi:hypothetical protein MKEN_01413700 [Mycena kentingensis (nom. inval.)]|nr:hypothetical protein MKEN_01413700 [Mycena kentingensis (nom. inval.)]